MNQQQRQQRERTLAALDLLDADTRSRVVEVLEELILEAAKKAALIAFEFDLDQAGFEQIAYRLAEVVESGAERLCLKAAGRLN